MKKSAIITLGLIGAFGGGIALGTLGNKKVEEKPKTTMVLQKDEKNNNSSKEEINENKIEKKKKEIESNRFDKEEAKKPTKSEVTTPIKQVESIKPETSVPVKSEVSTSIESTKSTESEKTEDLSLIINTIDDVLYSAIENGSILIKEYGAFKANIFLGKTGDINIETVYGGYLENNKYLLNELEARLKNHFNKDHLIKVNVEYSEKAQSGNLTNINFVY